MSNQKYNYIEKCISLTKLDHFAPWLMKYLHPLDGQRVVEVYLENKYQRAGSVYNDIPVIKIGPDFNYILNEIVPRITNYPYSWDLEGEKIDPNGYDFYTDFERTGKSTFIEIVDSAKTITWEKLLIKDPNPPLSFDVVKEEEVSGTMLSKIGVTFAKAGPISNISFDLYSIHPMNLESLVYISDTSRYVVPQKLNLKEIGIKQDDYTININLSRPIFAKQLILVFSQNNALQNTYSFTEV